MKHVLIIILYFVSGWVFSQSEPSNRATELLLNAEPDRVSKIIQFARNKWGDSKDSIEYEVEKQSYCYIMVYAMMGNPETTTEEQLIIRSEIMREVTQTNSEGLENVDWFKVYREVRHKLKRFD